LKKRGTAEVDMMRNAMKVFTGSGSLGLARSICKHLSIQLGDAVVERLWRESEKLAGMA
jgi:phosphoribosylpyrophosphate synthetase